MENKKKKYAKEIEQIRRESGAKPELCMVCGKCSGSCPAFDEMDVHPHQFAQMILRGELDELMNSRGIYKCMSCFTCSERCPRGGEPAKLVEAVRIAVIRRQDANHMKPEDVPAKLDPELPQQAIVSAFRKYAK